MYAHPAYHGRKNHPEQVREQGIYLREWRMLSLLGIQNHNLVIFLVFDGESSGRNKNSRETFILRENEVTETKQKVDLHDMIVFSKMS